MGGSADLTDVERFIDVNLPVLRTFGSVVVATNFDQPDLAAANRDLWRAHLPDCVLLDSPVNRGHSIGTADLDNMLFDHARGVGARWLCKSANDMFLSPELFDVPIEPADFYFLNAVSYSALRQHNFDRGLFGADFLYPQTTFYVIDVTAVDDLNDRGELDRAWEHVRGIADYNGRIWEYLPGFTCERLLRDCVLRNGLRRCHLMTPDQWQEVLDLVIAHRIEDCSFKGLQINGICHGQGLASPRDTVVIAG